MWQEAERRRLAALAERYKNELRRNEEWVDDDTQIRGQQYSWDLEGDMQGATKCQQRRCGCDGETASPDT